MTRMTVEQLMELAERRAATCLSIFLPIRFAPQEWQHDRLVLKNLLEEAERQLAERGLRPAEITRLLAPVEPLMGDGRFWSHLSDGLALFFSPDEFRTLTVPLAFEQQVVVGPRYYLKPLIPLLSGDGVFYILALSQNQVRLFQATRSSVEEVEIKGVPRSLDEALQYDDFEKEIQFRSSVPSPGGGSRFAIFHGHGALSDVQKTNLLRYFHLVDQGLMSFLGAQNAPLVLAAVDYLHPIYRKANTYPHLLNQGVEGNPDNVHPKLLHQRAWEIVQPLFDRQRQEKLEALQAALGGKRGKCAVRLEEVLPACDQGRVDTLFLAKGAQVWGHYDGESGQVTLKEENDPEGRDLLDLAAVRTLRTAGMVYILEEAEMPVVGPVAALLRY